ncbi:MAG: ankyrin repeat domain-containing protein [Proteobacteria bacterium]|nr:ankyrin repeat domain-containing protein [Pseudomonadota bacterium]
MADKKSQQEKFIEAAAQGDIQLVRESLDKNVVDVNQKLWLAGYSQSATALGLATYYGRSETVQLLLERGASIYAIADSNERTALQIATIRGHDHIHALLKQEEFTRLAKETVEWSLFGSTKLVHVEVSPVAARKLTEIFNFESRERLMISENLQTGVEATMPPVSFETLTEVALDKAWEKFTSLGGVADKDFTVRGTRRLEKSPQ